MQRQPTDRLIYTSSLGDAMELERENILWLFFVLFFFPLWFYKPSWLLTTFEQKAKAELATSMSLVWTPA